MLLALYRPKVLESLGFVVHLDYLLLQAERPEALPSTENAFNAFYVGKFMFPFY